jgi:hypothetical protein
MNGKADASGSLQGQVVQEHGGSKTEPLTTPGLGYANRSKSKQAKDKQKQKNSWEIILTDISVQKLLVEGRRTRHKAY